MANDLDRDREPNASSNQCRLILISFKLIFLSFKIAITNMLLDLKPLKNALMSLDVDISKEKDEFIRDSVIQRFEFTYELSWKFLSRHLALDLGGEAVDKLSRRDLYRTGAEKGLIRDAATWFEYHTARNTTLHTYNVSIAEQVYEVARKFSADAHFLLDKLIEIYK